MNPSDPIEIDSFLDEKAAEWLFEREEGFTPERAKAFTVWCSENSRHAEAVARVQRTLAILDEMPAVRAPLEARVGQVPPATGPIPTASNSPRWLARAVWTAGIAAALAVGFATWRSFSIRETPALHYSTDAAAQRSMLLPDGSVLDLNVHTDVEVQFTARERRILLNSGEAHFQVAHDSARPFTVAAGGVSVRAVGTAFNVRRAGKGIDVLVVEGKVEFSQGAAPAGKPFGEAAPLLIAGDRVQLAQIEQPIAPRIVKVDVAEIQSLLTWQNPLTNFADVPLRDVVARFNRRNTTQLILADADLGDRRIGGMIALDRVDAFVRLLEQDGDIVADRGSGAGIVLRHAR